MGCLEYYVISWSTVGWGIGINDEVVCEEWIIIVYIFYL